MSQFFIMMRDFFTFIIDLIFPPSPEALELRALSPATLFTRLPPAPTPPYPFITSLFAYKNPLVRELVLSIKNRKDRHAIELGAYALREVLKGTRGKIVLVPIPISKKRRSERGYNQCELLIDAIDGFEKNFNLLMRAKHTEQQKFKNRKGRLAGTEDLFEVKEALVDKDHSIILIDDVATTGSTLKEAREALLRAGYMNVKAVTLAH